MQTYIDLRFTLNFSPVGPVILPRQVLVSRAVVRCVSSSYKAIAAARR